MIFRTELAVYDDIEILISLYLRALENDQLYPYMYPNLTWEEKVQFECSGPKRVFHAQPWTKLYKMVESETNNIVAWARWHYPRQLTDDERAMEGDPDLFDPVPTGANQKLCYDLFGPLEDAEHKYVDRENRYLINYLFVDPKYQGLGLGLRLLKIGMDEADRTKQTCFLVSTPNGHGLYLKHGFKEIDRFTVDPRPHGGKDEAVWISMRRGSTQSAVLGTTATGSCGKES